MKTADNRITHIAALFFLAVHFILALSCASRNAPTCDEIAHHVASGYSYLTTRDFRLNPANPPLVRMLSAFPLLFLDLESPVGSDSWNNADSPRFGQDFFYKYNNNAGKIIFFSRVPIALLSVILGWLVYRLAVWFFGCPAALLSIVLYCFSPNIIANAGLATVDLGAALFTFASVYALLAYLRRPCLKLLLVCSVCIGLAQAAKFSSIILWPLLAVFLFIANSRCKDPQMKKAFSANKFLQIFFIAYCVVWIIYGLEFKPLLNAGELEAKQPIISELAGALPAVKGERLSSFLENTPVPMASYIRGLSGVLRHNARGGLDVFVLGKHHSSGVWYYFPLALLAKSTLPVLTLLLLSLFFVFRPPFRKEKAMVFCSALLIVLAAIPSNVQVGVRHILPAYPFIFVLCTAPARHLAKSRFIIFLSLILLSEVISLSRVLPYPIAYFNELFGGAPNGYNVLRDSNLDWGQGIKAFGAYASKNRIKQVKLLYFGTADPAYYKIDRAEFNKRDFERPQPGYCYAISAQYIDTVKWAAQRKPDAVIAYSIFVYRLDLEQR